MPKKIGNLDVEYTVLDDASDSTPTVALIKKLLIDKVDAIIGPSGSPNSMAALRDALEGTRELVGTQGVYNMSAADHSGFDRRGRELMQLTGGVWRLIPQ